MGEVYLAEDSKLGRKVALKVLPDLSQSSDKARRRLLQEARSASALNHPNIVTIHSIEQSDGVDFIVMEYVEGETLASKLTQGPLSFPKLLDLAMQIAEGLGAAHQANIIHRDIKPANILVTNQGRAKILDFGLARETIAQEHASTGGQRLTEEGWILGTLTYMSPEQVRGDELDSQSDLFSFGTLLYEAATGRLPFRGPNPNNIMYQIVNQAVIPPSGVALDLPAEFDAIVIRALAKDKALRYKTAEEIVEQLQALSFPRTAVISSVAIPSPLLSKDTSFVGRQTETDQLQQHFVSLIQSSGKTVFLMGEPGIGKTALSEHFLRTISPAHSGVFVAKGRCVEHYGTGEAYLPFLDAVGTILHGVMKERAIGVLRANAPTWCMQFPAAFASTGVLESSQKEAAAASKDRMLRELSDALIELSTISPFILFLEDLHWADPSSADLLRYLARRILGKKILILGTMREEDLEEGNPPMKACRLDLQAQTLSDEIRLKRLSQPQVVEYLNRFFSPNTFPQEFSDMIFRKTEGHPLFVASLLQFLVNEKVIEKANEVWSLTKPLSEMDLEVPESVRSMIQRKMELLSDEDRRVLQFAAIEGIEFASTVLADLVGMDDIDLEEQLSRIEKKYRLIVHAGEEDWPDGSLASKYHFVHSLYQNAFYSDLVAKRRTQLHKLAGESLLKHYGEKANTIANKLGAHFRIGRDFERAAQYLALAGDYAKTLYANMEAEQLYGQALSQLEDLIRKDPAAWKPTSVILHEKRGDSLSLLGKQPEAKEEYEAALALTDSSAILAMGRMHRKIAKVAETQRDLKRALDLYLTAENLLAHDLENQSVDVQREWLEVYLDRSWSYYTQNLQKEMLQDLSLMEPFIKKIGTPTQRFRHYQNCILLAFRRERYRISNETLSLLELLQKAATETGIASDMAQLSFVSGFAYLWHGDLKSAEKNIELALSQAVRLEDAVLQSRCLTYLTVAFRKQGNREQVETFAERSLQLSSAIHMQEYVAAAKANQSWLHLRAREFEESRKLSVEAIQIWQSLPVVSPFQELAVWPIIAVLIPLDQISDACKYAEILLHSDQRKQDDDMEELLRAAIQADKAGNSAIAKEKLSQATNIAEAQGYS